MSRANLYKPLEAHCLVGIFILLSLHLGLLMYFSYDALIPCPAVEACLTPSRWQVGDSTETLVTVFSTTPMPVDVFPNAIAQMKRVQVLKFDLEGALTKGGEVEDLSLADEDRVGKGRGQLSRSFGSGLGTYWW
ncbi:hypothetical protein BHE74_00056766 [Ensete ventricosum]|nr:hypothetical protein BHE74_00056766 [Ensete ventricosum]RZS23357.1 hypothetical protein BHM03_00056269 [Ensete ventricosum]